MPFTFCHPAIVLPIYLSRKRWFSLTGLIVGSVVPDFEYFIRLRVLSKYSHTMAGLFYFDLPLALILAFLFHSCVKKKVVLNLPEFLRSRFWRYLDFNWTPWFRKHWWIVTISILVGASSHIAWDGFTHKGGLIVSRFEPLQQPFIVGHYSIPYYKIAQHVSSILGFLVIAYYVGMLPKSNTQTTTRSTYYWFAVLACTFILSLLSILKMGIPGIGSMIVIGLSALMSAIIVVPK